MRRTRTKLRTRPRTKPRMKPGTRAKLKAEAVIQRLMALVAQDCLSVALEQRHQKSLCLMSKFVLEEGLARRLARLEVSRGSA